MIFQVTPIGKPRMTQRDRWKKRPCVLAYHAYRDTIRLQARGWEPADRCTLLFYLPMPKSWSAKKRAQMLGEPHQQKPDIDNLVKAFLDCFGEDKAIWAVEAVKRWSEQGRIEVFP